MKARRWWLHQPRISPRSVIVCMATGRYGSMSGPVRCAGLGRIAIRPASIAPLQMFSMRPTGDDGIELATSVYVSRKAPRGERVVYVVDAPGGCCGPII